MMESFPFKRIFAAVKGGNAGFSTSLRSGRNDEVVVNVETAISPLRCEMTNPKRGYGVKVYGDCESRCVENRK